MNKLLPVSCLLMGIGAGLLALDAILIMSKVKKALDAANDLNRHAYVTLLQCHSSLVVVKEALRYMSYHNFGPSLN